MITASGRTGLFPGTGGAGFAIPSNDALGIVRDIRAGDESSTIVIGEAGFIGVRVRPLTPDLATEYGLHVTQGALVIDAVQGMPAANAGIGEGSVVTSVDGTTVDTVDELGPLLHQHHPGDTVNVTWIDASGSHNADVTLVAGPAV
jgi:S1-C subfamily serine protease